MLQIPKVPTPETVLPMNSQWNNDTAIPLLRFNYC